MEFALWKHIGREFLVRSNIDNDIACSPGTGSLVDSTTGTVSCTLIYDVVQNGSIWYEITDSGTYLRANIYAMYVWTGSTDINWPAHDPCGMNQPNHKKGVSNPGGQPYLRMSKHLDIKENPG